jgi:hypothetical protein
MVRARIAGYPKSLSPAARALRSVGRNATLDQLSDFAGYEVEHARPASIRAMWRAIIRGEDTDRLAASTHERDRLKRTHAGTQVRFERWSVHEQWALGHVFDDHRLRGLRSIARTLRLRDLLGVFHI